MQKSAGKRNVCRISDPFLTCVFQFYLPSLSLCPTPQSIQAKMIHTWLSTFLLIKSLSISNRSCRQSYQWPCSHLSLLSPLHSVIWTRSENSSPYHLPLSKHVSVFNNPSMAPPTQIPMKAKQKCRREMQNWFNFRTTHLCTLKSGKHVSDHAISFLWFFVNLSIVFSWRVQCPWSFYSHGTAYFLSLDCLLGGCGSLEWLT